MAKGWQLQGYNEVSSPKDPLTEEAMKAQLQWERYSACMGGSGM